LQRDLSKRFAEADTASENDWEDVDLELFQPARVRTPTRSSPSNSDGMMYRVKKYIKQAMGGKSKLVRK
jgi:hypothetical protein